MMTRDHHGPAKSRAAEASSTPPLARFVVGIDATGVHVVVTSDALVEKVLAIPVVDTDENAIIDVEFVDGAGGRCALGFQRNPLALRMMHLAAGWAAEARIVGGRLVLMVEIPAPSGAIWLNRLNTSQPELVAAFAASLAEPIEPALETPHDDFATGAWS